MSVNVVVFLLLRFDFSGKTPLMLRRHVENTVESVADGRCDAVLMWWELEMMESTQLMLSTAPYWAHPTPDSIQVNTKHGTQPIPTGLLLLCLTKRCSLIILIVFMIEKTCRDIAGAQRCRTTEMKNPT